MQKNWQTDLTESFKRVSDLLAFLQLESSAVDSDLSFPFLVTRSFAGRMQKGDPDDPLLRQVLPSLDETFAPSGFSADPVGDLSALAAPGLLHKYAGRVLLLATGACAIHCRYCFRRSFPYEENQLTRSREQQALRYIEKDESIEEVILSGGDALLLNDARFKSLVEQIDAIEHIKRIRIHSRIPIVLPSRMTDELMQTFKAARAKIIMVVHANHAREIDASVGYAFKKMRESGVHLLNQSVLLKGVNDSLEALAELSETLFEQDVTPYYIHLLDKALGTAHFDIPEGQALALHESLRARMPGYMVPKLVREEAGKPYKTLMAHSSLAGQISSEGMEGGAACSEDFAQDNLDILGWG